MSATVSCTYTREPAVQSWPVLYRMPSAAQFAAARRQRPPHLHGARHCRGGRTLVEVRAREDELRGLAAELERHLLEVAVRRGGHDLAPGDGAARERDLVDAAVRRERRAADAAQRRHRVHDARREPAARGTAHGAQTRQSSLSA